MRALQWVFRIILWFFALIGLTAALAIVALVIIASRFAIRPVAIAANTVLTLDLERPVTEAAQPETLDRLFEPRTVSFTALLAAVRRGAEDARVKGLVARTGSAQLGLGQAEELRAAIKAFRAKGKFAYAFADSFGEISGGTRSYYLASGFDEIWLQPGGGVAVTGVAAQAPFFKGALDKLGVTAQFERRGEYKTAAAQFTDSKMPDTDRAAYADLLASIYGQMVHAIADGRQIAEDQVKALIDGAPYSAEDALAKHLVDHVGYRDEAEDAARQKAGADAKLMTAGAYAHAVSVGDSGRASASSIGVIRAVGTITSGPGSEGGWGEDGSVGADTAVHAFEQAIEDQSVKAIVLRIDSPGGSEVASESIWRAVKRAQAAGKPVIVSMGDVAASGGYYIAAGADKILADPLTITGSIGVFGGKFVLAGLFDKLGVGWDTVALGQNATMDSALTPFTPAQQQRFAALIDLSYQAFLTRVADGRHLTTAQVDAIARGRVWTGAQAKEHGLVDALGGLDAAIAAAQAAAHLAPGTPPALKSFTGRASTFDQFMQGLVGGGQEAPQLLAALHRLAALAPLLERLSQAADLPAAGDATMRPVEIRD